MKIDVTSKVKVYEIDGLETKPLENINIEVHNHWNITDFVVLTVDGKQYTVLADQLHRAIQNATNQAIGS